MDTICGHEGEAEINSDRSFFHRFSGFATRKLARALKTYDAIRIFKKINKENDKEDINCLIVQHIILRLQSVTAYYHIGHIIILLYYAKTKLKIFFDALDKAALYYLKRKKDSEVDIIIYISLF